MSDLDHDPYAAPTGQVEDELCLPAVLGMAKGRRFVHQMLASAGVWRLSFNNEPHVTSFNEGARNIGLALLSNCYAQAPELTALMLSENTK